MRSSPNIGDRVTVPFNVEGHTEDAAGTVVNVLPRGTKVQVVIRLDGHGQEEVTYPLDAVEPLKSP